MLLPPFLLLVFIMLQWDRILTHIVNHLSNTSYHLQYLYCPGGYLYFRCKVCTWHVWHIGEVSETHPEGCWFEPRHDLFRNSIFVSCAITNNTNCVSFIALTGTVKHVVRGRNKQVLPQWICLRCNIQFDNMGSVIFF
jgi:hypothetical protein